MLHFMIKQEERHRFHLATLDTGNWFLVKLLKFLPTAPLIEGSRELINPKLQFN